MLHGAPADRTWQWMLPDLSHGHTVVAWDALGFGQSSDIDGTWRAAQSADALAASSALMVFRRRRTGEHHDPTAGQNAPQRQRTAARRSRIGHGQAVFCRVPSSSVQAASACAAAATFSAPWVVSCSTMRTKLGCSSPETRNVQR